MDNRPFPNRIAELALAWSLSLPLLMTPTPLVQEKARQWLGWLPRPCHTRTPLGFTLAELLISLALVGVIATFIIPKIVSNSTQTSYKSMAKEVASMVASAFQQYQQQNTVSGSFKIANLTPYMNYVVVYTGGSVDLAYTNGTIVCNGAAAGCLKMHNGSIFGYYPNETFTGTAANNAVWFWIDPDAAPDGTTNGPAKSMWFMLTASGRITDIGSLAPGTTSSSGTFGPTPNRVPPWFDWN